MGHKILTNVDGLKIHSDNFSTKSLTRGHNLAIKKKHVSQKIIMSPCSCKVSTSKKARQDIEPIN